MIYELKRYTPPPGKGKALKERFAQVTIPIFERIGIRVLHCWEDTSDPDALLYLVVFANPEERDAAWRTFGAEVEWKAAKAASEVGGPLLASQTTTEMRPTAFSPGARC